MGEYHNLRGYYYGRDCLLFIYFLELFFFFSLDDTQIDVASTNKGILVSWTERWLHKIKHALEPVWQLPRGFWLFCMRLSYRRSWLEKYLVWSIFSIFLYNIHRMNNKKFQWVDRAHENWTFKKKIFFYSNSCYISNL